jgi:hypothetical protein
VSGGTRFAQAAGGVSDGINPRRRAEDGSNVPRNPWRARAKVIGAMAAGVLAGILVGILLVHLLLTPNAPRP